MFQRYNALLLLFTLSIIAIPFAVNAQIKIIDIPASKRISPNEIEVAYKPVTGKGFGFVTTATDSKKRWEGKRPKGGNGPGVYSFYEGESCNTFMDGNWKDYKLDGPFRKLYKGIPVFEGIAEDGVVLSGTSYSFMYIYSRITQSHISTEEKENFRANIMGTHIAPEFVGTVQEVVAKDGSKFYGYDSGIIFKYREYPTGLKAISAEKGQWMNEDAYSPQNQKPLGSMDYYFSGKGDKLYLTNTISYANRKIDGLVTLYKEDGNRVEADYKDNLPAADGQTVQRNSKGVITAVYDHNFTLLYPNSYSEHLKLTYGGWSVYFPENGKPFRRFETGGKAVSDEVANIPAPGLTFFEVNNIYPEISWQSGRYAGELVNGIPNGWGRLYNVYNGGNYMEGNFKDGKPSGYTMLVSIEKSKRDREFGNSYSQLELYKDGVSYKGIWGLTEKQRNTIAEENRKKLAEQKLQIRQEQIRITDRWYDVDAQGNRTRRALPGKEGWFQHVIYPPKSVIDGNTYPATNGFYVIYRSGIDEKTKDQYMIATTQTISFGMDENRNVYRAYPTLWAANMITSAYYASDDRIGELSTYAGKFLKLGLKDGNSDARLILFENKGGSIIIQLPAGERSFKNNTTVSMKMIFTTRKVDQDFLREPEVRDFF